MPTPAEVMKKLTAAQAATREALMTAIDCDPIDKTLINKLADINGTLLSLTKPPKPEPPKK